jgi:hypothetical protein
MTAKTFLLGAFLARSLLFSVLVKVNPLLPFLPGHCETS